jgi:hypothetical protein
MRLAEKRREKMFTVDLHGYQPQTVEENDLILDSIKQAWEMAKDSVVFVHGHARRRASQRPFANTKTGYLGLRIRGILRHDDRLRPWMYSKIDVSQDGSTTVRLRKNDQPTRKKFDADAWPDHNFRS